jgi:hypothetical protein
LRQFAFTSLPQAHEARLRHVFLVHATFAEHNRSSSRVIEVSITNTSSRLR